jgi:carbonic anhydrase
MDVEACARRSRERRLGLIDNWLRHVEAIRRRHDDELAALSPEAAVDRLCELNVIEQARHVCDTTVVHDAWARRQRVAVHGWIYGLSDGRLRDLGFAATRHDEVEAAYERAVNSSTARQISFDAI